LLILSHTGVEQLQAAREAILRVIEEFTGEYIWHKDQFSLRVIPERQKEEVRCGLLPDGAPRLDSAGSSIKEDSSCCFTVCADV
jgi:hypothetical protein